MPGGFFFFALKSRHSLALAIFVACSLIATAIYWPGLQGGFFFDDGPSILQPEGVRLERLSPGDVRLALASGGAGPSGRPVAQLSFGLNHYASGFSPFAFKATNLAIHLCAGFLVFMLMLRLLVLSQPSRARLAGAVALAAIWLLHPIQVLPVLHIVQRMTSLSALFLFAAFLLHLRGRQLAGTAGTIPMVLAWAVLWPLSFLSKETGILFPFLVLAWELTVQRSACGSLDRFARTLSVVLLGAVAAAACYAISPSGEWLWAGYAMRSFTPGERLLTEGRIIWFYLGLILLPRLEALGLYHDDIPLSGSLFDPWTTLPAILGLGGLLWIAWKWRDKSPLTAFGILWFLIGHMLESTVLPLEIAHEHRNYLPLFGLLLVAGEGWLYMHARSGAYRTLGITLALGLLVYYPFVTALRAHQYGDDLRRTQIEAQHHRQSARAQYEAGQILSLQAEAALPDSPVHAFARTHLERAGELDPLAKMSWLGLIQLNCRAGLPVERSWIEALGIRLRDTPFAPADRNVLFSLKELAIDKTLCLERAEVEGFFADALQNRTASPSVRAMLYSWLADYRMLAIHDSPAAQMALDQSLAIAPYNPSNRLKRAQLAFLQGRYDEARMLLNRLKGADLVNSERETVNMLEECLAQGGSAQCAMK